MAKVVETGVGEAFDQAASDAIAMMGALAGALPSGKLEAGIRKDLETSSIFGHRPEIVALRHIHDTLIRQIPEGKRWGDLRPVQTKAHGLLWLCPEHAAIQEPPVQTITGPKYSPMIP